MNTKTTGIQSGCANSWRWVLTSFLLLTVLLPMETTAQLVGGRGNGQSAPSAVGASSITAGGFSGDVSLFTGTYNSSYTLGSVSTPSGLSFTASLSYSSTFSTGENLPHTSGIPYGEGWSLDLPMISVSTETYNKYTLWETAQMQNAPANENSPTRDFDEDAAGNPSCTPAYEEGDLYWFSPMLSIPGVASGRLVFKSMDASGNATFVLHKFERYIEVLKRGNVWEVIQDDGTRYEMNVRVLSHRNSANQRVQSTCVDALSSKNMLLPKSEINTWYCTRIRNVNAIGSVQFIYNAFGSFNYYQELEQANMVGAIGDYFFSSNNAGDTPPLAPVYKDVLLKEIRTGSERLVLDYESISTANGYKMLDINDAAVSRKDSMYSYTTVKKWGGQGEAPFSDWYRYKHLKADNVPNNFATQINKLNPYKGRNTSPSSNGQDVYYREKVASGASSTPFLHNYFESPRISLLSGETYEIRTKVNTPNVTDVTASGQECSFDINLATGDYLTFNTASGQYPFQQNGPGFIHAAAYEQATGQSVFSTFNQGIKWNNYAYGTDLMQTSNFFTMQNLPSEFGGFSIQVGPAISDNAFDLSLEQLVSNPCNASFSTGVTYLNGSDLESDPALRGVGWNHRPGGDIANNFGIGIPFYLAKGLHDELYGTTNFEFWWWMPQNDYCANSVDNRPTRADNSTLKEVELVRFSKNPYMLKRVTKYVLNVGDGSIDGSGDPENAFWREISSMGFSYDIVTTPLYAHKRSIGNSNPYEYDSEFRGYRNIVRLKKIKQLPRAWDEATASTAEINALATTHLEYDSLARTGWTSILGQDLNSSIAILTKVVDPLGKETRINYGGNYASTKFLYKWRPSDVTANNNVVRRANPSAYQIYMRVASMETIDRDGTSAIYNYTYGARKSISNLMPMDEHYKYDFQGNVSIGHESTKVSGPTGADGTPYVRYFHHTDYLKWGKLNKVINYDATNRIAGINTIEYEAVLAYENPMHRIKNSQYDYEEYKIQNGGLYSSRPTVVSSNPSETALKNYYDLLYNWMNVLDYDLEDEIEHLGLDFDMPVFDCHNSGSLDCNCYDDFDALSDTDKASCIAVFNKQKELSDFLNNLDLVYVNDNHPDFNANAGMYEAPYFYESRNFKPIQDYQPHLLNSYFIKKTKESNKQYDDYHNASGLAGRGTFETITEYSYFDADYRGMSSSEGYAALTKGGQEYDASFGLYFEPSWGLYSKKTHSPQMHDAWTLEENFYLYDLINDKDYWGSTGYGPSSDFFDLWSIWTRQQARNALFQTRVTTVARGEAPVTKSTFYNYSREWEVTQGDATITYEPAGDLWPCQQDDNGGGNGGNGNGDDPDWDYVPTGCFPYFVQSNTVEYCPFNFIQQLTVYCPCDMTFNNNPPNNDNANNLINNDPGGGSAGIEDTPLGGKLMLKSVVQQTGTTGDTGEVLRFATGISNFEPIYPTDDILTLKTILARGAYGQIVKEENERGIITKYEYEPVHILAKPYCANELERYNWFYLTNHLGLPKAVIVGDGRPDALRTEYSYNLDNSLDEIIDANQMKLHYEYDEYGRMIAGYRNDELLQEASYSHWENDQTQSFKERALMNVVDQKNHLDTPANGGGYVGSKAYVDPLGRNVANVNYGGNVEVAVENNIYDIYGRTVVQLKPSGGGPVVNLGSIDPTEHAEYAHDVAPINRPLKSAKYGESIQGNHVVDYSYYFVSRGTMKTEIDATGKLLHFNGIQGQRFMRTRTTDEDGKMVIEFTNGFGQKVASITNNGTIATIFRYGSQGNVTEVSNAKEQQSKYKYNYLGQLYEKLTVDGGTTYYAYDHSGNLICESHANGHISMYRYDDYGRMIEQKHSETPYLSNEGRPWMTDTADVIYNGIMDNALFEKTWSYEDYDANSPNIAGNAQNYLDNSITYAKGKVVQTTSYDLTGNPIEYRFVSYTKDGFLKWEINQFNQNGLQSGGPGILTRIDYPFYNLQGNYKVQNVDLNCDQTLDFQYAYEYDTWNRLENVYVNYDDAGTEGHLIASYTYDDEIGVVKKKTYYATRTHIDETTNSVTTCKNELIDETEYAYDARFRLTDIQSTLFDWKLYYDNQSNTNHQANFVANYNGNINASLGTYKFDLAENIPSNFSSLSSSAYNYRYDNLNRLILADAQINLPEPIPSGHLLGDAQYVYDKIGNFERLNRWHFAAQNFVTVTESKYTYDYGTNNRLTEVKEEVIGAGGGSITNTTVANYTYDQSGNLSSDSKRKLTVGDYGRAHLPWKLNRTSDLVTSDPEGGSSSALSSDIKYMYDVNDARIYKSASGNLGPETSEYYLRSASGQELAIYDLNTDELTWYVYGNERVAKIKHTPQLTIGEEGERGTTYEGRPTGYPTGTPPNTECSSRERRCLSYGVNLTRNLLRNEQLSNLQAENLAKVTSLQELYLNENYSQLNLPDTWLQLQMSDGTESYVLQSKLSTIQGTYTITDQLVLNSTAQQIQLVLNGKFLHLSLSEVLGAETAENMSSSANTVDPFTEDLLTLSAPGAPAGSYYVQDHLGNTRVVYEPVFCGEQTNGEPMSYAVEYVGDYFPYGKTIREYVSGEQEKFLTTEHERDIETGLDYRGARFYDADIGRFLSLDPLAADYAAWSPYNYVLSNPIILIDPTGKSSVYVDGVKQDMSERDMEFFSSSLNSYFESREIKNEKLAKSDSKLRKVKLIVTNETVGEAHVSGYSHDNGRTDNVFKVPLYKMILEGIDVNGEKVSREFSVIRFGILQYHTGEKASVVGLADRQTHNISQWRPDYLDGLVDATPGAWRVMGGHLLHDGADNPTAENAWGAIGCVEVCGENGFGRLNWLVRKFTGTSTYGENAYKAIIKRKLLQIHFEKAKRPPLNPILN
ncbi:MAG: RHS repeat-associated core domain-containing protein [Saprospiraceae bacterium]